MIGAPALSSGVPIAGAPIAALQRQGGDLGPRAPIAGAQITALPQAGGDLDPGPGAPIARWGLEP